MAEEKLSAQAKASIKSQKNNCKQYKILLSKSTDQDIINHLDSLKNKQGYIKELIRKDIGK